MALLGNPLHKAFSEIPKQTITGNGTAGPYTLNYSAGGNQEIEVFVNNVRQEPGVAYTVSGTSLTMTGNVSYCHANDGCFSAGWTGVNSHVRISVCARTIKCFCLKSVCHFPILTQ